MSEFRLQKSDVPVCGLKCKAWHKIYTFYWKLGTHFLLIGNKLERRRMVSAWSQHNNCTEAFSGTLQDPAERVQ